MYYLLKSINLKITFRKCVCVSMSICAHVWRSVPLLHVGLGAELR